MLVCGGRRQALCLTALWLLVRVTESHLEWQSRFVKSLQHLYGGGEGVGSGAALHLII